MKLGEVCLLTHDVCRLANFYRRLLDISDTSDDPVHQMITAQEPMLAIYNDGQEHSAALSPVSLAFTVEDIHAAHEKLLALKAEIVQPPTRQPWGAINLIFRDPDGNLIYLRQLPSSKRRILMSVQLPSHVPSGLWNYGHCQGIAIDTQRKYMYFSFTTALIKTDLDGNVIGSVTGLLGHLGCIDFNDEDGRVYGSLEYKNDAIGQGILKHAGVTRQLQTAFYIVAFDVDKIDRMDMDACTDGVMTSVYLSEVVRDYTGSVENNGRVVEHRHGCSGIDGMTFGCIPGTNTRRLFVAYGVYGDTARTDNDYQVILCYDPSGWKQYEQPLSQQNMHQSGPDQPEHKFFVYTGNTTWGVQNLEYDEHTGHLLMAVYRGSKESYPNYDLYIIDGSKTPYQTALRGVEPEMTGEILTLLDNGSGEETPGWRFPHGSTGICSLGDGRFYVSVHGKENGLHYTNVQLFSWDEITAQ